MTIVGEGVRLLRTFAEWQALSSPPLTGDGAATVFLGGVIVATTEEARSVHPELPPPSPENLYIALPYALLRTSAGHQVCRLPPELAGWLKMLRDLRAELPIDVEFGRRPDGSIYAEVL